jgi:drug/metabolite transporter (DMT)-like permease
MLASMPLWSVWLARRIAGERLSGRQLVGVVVSVLGIALAFVEPDALRAGGRALIGDGLLLTALLGAVYGVLAKRALARDAAVTVTAYAMLFGCVLLVPAALAAALLGVWLLDERRSVPFAIGFAAVVAGVALVNWPSGA